MLGSSMKEDKQFDLLSIYFRDIARFMPMKSEEEYRLVAEIRQGNSKAREKLITANLRFVISVARQYIGQGLEFSDIINEGNKGLIRASYIFDERKNFKFISYAVWWIRQSILKALADQSRYWSLPVSAVGIMYKMSRMEERLMQQLQRAPSWDELVAACGRNKELMLQLFSAGRKPLSFDAAPCDGEETLLAERVSDTSVPSPEQFLFNKCSYGEVERLLSRLDYREHTIVTGYYGICHDKRNTLEELARKLNISRERVRQIKAGALRRLRNDRNHRVLIECAAERG
jgi:RNA polymerase primary sigma factor